MLHKYATNEFKNSAIAQSKRDTRTTWSEAKPMVIGCAVVFTVLIITFLIKY